MRDSGSFILNDLSLSFYCLLIDLSFLFLFSLSFSGRKLFNKTLQNRRGQTEIMLINESHVDVPTKAGGQDGSMSK